MSHPPWVPAISQLSSSFTLQPPPQTRVSSLWIGSRPHCAPLLTDSLPGWLASPTPTLKFTCATLLQPRRPEPAPQPSPEAILSLFFLGPQAVVSSPKQPGQSVVAGELVSGNGFQEG